MSCGTLAKAPSFVTVTYLQHTCHSTSMASVNALVNIGIKKKYIYCIHSTANKSSVKQVCSQERFTHSVIQMIAVVESSLKGKSMSECSNLNFILFYTNILEKAWKIAHKLK